MTLSKKVVFCAWLVALPFFAFPQTPLHPYQTKAGVAGNITSVGSDTLANLSALWSEEFKRYYPQVKFHIQASGSATAPPALAEGLANIGPMSRALKPSEINYFVRKHGYKPTVLKVAIDAIALFVHRHNQVESLSIREIDGIFSVTRYCGQRQPIISWSQLNHGTKQLNSRYIRMFGRNSVSGTYGLFKQNALCAGDFKGQVNEMPGSASIVQSVSLSPDAIGYGALGSINAGVRVVPIRSHKNDIIEATSANILSGRYPLARFLFVVINKEPDTPLPDLELEYLRFILSSEGQDLVRQEGYLAVSPQVARKQVQSLISL